MEQQRWVRVGVARAVRSRHRLWIWGRAGARSIEGDSAALVEGLLDVLRTPRTRDEIRHELSQRFDGLEGGEAIVDQGLEELEQAGLIGAEEPRPEPRRVAQRKLVLGISGAVAAALAPTLVLHLQKRGFAVRCALTSKAHRFVRPEALEALTHQSVARSLWAGVREGVAAHLQLAEWADAMLLYPASATTLSRLARGDFGDVVSATALCMKGPVLVAPSMNAAMWDAPAVRRNVETLVEDGFHLLLPTHGAEVADRPEARRRVFGSAPPPEVVAATLEALLVGLGLPARVEGRDAWDRLYRQTAPADRPWQVEAADADLVAAIAQLPRGTLWEVGCGDGVLACEAARLGHTVIATDVAPAAIDAARARAQGLPVILLEEDVTVTRLQAEFDAVVDRATLHVLPRSAHLAYATTLAARLKPGGRLILKVHAAGAPESLGTCRFTPAELEALFAPAFRVERVAASTLPGPKGSAPAWLAVLERRTAEGG